MHVAHSSWLRLVIIADVAYRCVCCPHAIKGKCHKAMKYLHQLRLKVHSRPCKACHLKRSVLQMMRGFQVTRSCSNFLHGPLIHAGAKTVPFKLNFQVKSDQKRRKWYVYNPFIHPDCPYCHLTMSVYSVHTDPSSSWVKDFFGEFFLIRTKDLRTECVICCAECKSPLRQICDWATQIKLTWVEVKIGSSFLTL